MSFPVTKGFKIRINNPKDGRRVNTIEPFLPVFSLDVIPTTKPTQKKPE
jgi:hypothetical protein